MLLCFWYPFTAKLPTTVKEETERSSSVTSELRSLYIERSLHWIAELGHCVKMGLSPDKAGSTRKGKKVETSEFQVPACGRQLQLSKVRVTPHVGLSAIHKRNASRYWILSNNIWESVRSFNGLQHWYVKSKHHVLSSKQCMSEKCLMRFSIHSHILLMSSTIAE